MEFDDIKNQIEANYNEIQKETCRHVIKRLGLGTGVAQTVSIKCQTEEEYVHKSVYNELDMELVVERDKVMTLEKELKAMTEMFDKQKDTSEKLTNSGKSLKEKMKKL